MSGNLEISLPFQVGIVSRALLTAVPQHTKLNACQPLGLVFSDCHKCAVRQAGESESKAAGAKAELEAVSYGTAEAGALIRADRQLSFLSCHLFVRTLF